MAVTADIRIERLPWAGYDDPSLPEAAWVTQGGVSGDVTGGTMQLRVVFLEASSRQSARMFNLEQFHIHLGTNVTLQGQTLTENMGHLTAQRGLTTVGWGFTVTARASLSEAPIDHLSKAIWLGAPNLIGGRSSLAFAVANTDGSSINLSAYGYVWGPRSVLAPGGPQRPVNSPFG